MFLSADLEELFHSYHHSLVSYLRRLMKCSHFAEEIAQDTYLRLRAKGPTTSTINHPRAYLFRTAHNLAMDQLAKQSTEWKHRSSSEISVDIPSATPQPDTITESRERLQRMANALNELPESCRQAFVLNKIHQMTHAEIAQKLNVSQSMVEKHLMRALAHCRAKLQNEKPKTSSD